MPGPIRRRKKGGDRDMTKRPIITLAAALVVALASSGALAETGGGVSSAVSRVHATKPAPAASSAVAARPGASSVRQLRARRCAPRISVAAFPTWLLPIRAALSA